MDLFLWNIIFFNIVFLQYAQPLVPGTGNNSGNVGCAECGEDVKDNWWVWLLLLILMIVGCIGSICFHRNRKYCHKKFEDFTRKIRRKNRQNQNNTQTRPRDREQSSNRSEMPNVEVFTTYNTLHDSVTLQNINFDNEHMLSPYLTRSVTASPVLLINREPPTYSEYDQESPNTIQELSGPRPITPIRLVEEAPPSYKENIDSTISLQRVDLPPTYSSLYLRETSTQHR